MDQKKVSQVLFALINKGKERGFLDAEELKILDSLNLTERVKNEFFNTLRASNIDFETEDSEIEPEQPIENINDIDDNWNDASQIPEITKILDAELDNIESDIDDIDRRNKAEIIAAKSNIAKYLDEISKYPLLSPEEQKAATIRAVAGDEEAINLLIHSNLRLVVSIAKRYAGYTSSLTLDDMIQEGNIGLMTAIKKFKPELEYRFSTYATFWIRQSIIRAIVNTDKEVRLPINLQTKIGKINQFIKSKISANENRPTAQEIAEGTGYSLTQVKEALRVYNDFGNPVYLDAPLNIKDSSAATYGDLIASRKEFGNPETYEKIERTEKIYDIIRTLRPREQVIVMLRFGIVDGVQHTLQEVGVELSLTRERVRQLEASSVKKLRIGGRKAALSGL